MELRVTKNKYTATNNELTIDPVTKAVTATSYNWWVFVATDLVGNVIFNDYNYSSTTKRHQSRARYILKRLNIPVALYLRHTGSSLDGRNRSIYSDSGKLADCPIKSTILHEIAGIEDAMDKLNGEINRKGSRKDKNEERKACIKQHEYRIKDLRRFITDTLNKVKVTTKEYNTEKEREFLLKALSPLF